MANAVKFTPDGGKIRFDVLFIEENDTRFELRTQVSDNGIGVSSEQQSKLFDMFEQADNSTSREHGGSGLGLAISKRIVEMMGGQIWAESELGMGGLEATRLIRALPERQRGRLSIVAMTANVFQDDIDACIEAGMDDHLGKPFSIERVQEVLRKYLAR